MTQQRGTLHPNCRPHVSHSHLHHPILGSNPHLSPTMAASRQSPPPSPVKTLLTTLTTLNPLSHLHIPLSSPFWTFLENFYALPSPPQPRKRTQPMQVLCVGLPRTGTESLQQALIHLGYEHTYHGWDIVYDEECYAPGWVRLARRKWYSANNPSGGEGPEGKRKGAVITAAEFDELLGHSVAVTDAAASVFAAEMVAAYPEAKVVLNMRRDLDAWEKSLDGTLVHANESWGFWIASWLDRECFWAWHVYERFLWPLLFRAGDGGMKKGIRGNARWIQRGEFVSFLLLFLCLLKSGQVGKY